MQDFKFVKKLDEPKWKRQIIRLVTTDHDIDRRSFLIHELKPFICYQNDTLMIITQNPCFDPRQIRKLRMEILMTRPITQFSIIDGFSPVSTANTIAIISRRCFYHFENNILSFYLDLRNE